jgi:hypothetical protein
VLAGATVAGAVYGYRVLLAMSRVLSIGMTVLLALGVIAYAPHSTTGALPEAGGYLLGGFWPTWCLATVAAGLSRPIAFITLLGDYTRYISPARHTSRRVLHATWLGLAAGLLVPQLFGTFTAYAAHAALDYAGPLVRASPGWYLVPLLLAASGSVGNAGLMLYSMSLDLDAILPRASRARAACTVAVVATVCVFVGHYAWNAQSAMTSFVLFLTAIGTPWAVITLMGGGWGSRTAGGVVAVARGAVVVPDGRGGLQFPVVGGGGRRGVHGAATPGTPQPGHGTLSPSGVCGRGRLGRSGGLEAQPPQGRRERRAPDRLAGPGRNPPGDVRVWQPAGQT